MFPPYLGINWSVNFNKDVLLLTWTAVLVGTELTSVGALSLPPLRVLLGHCPQYCPSLSGSLLRFPANTGTGGSYLHLSSPVQHILSKTPAHCTVHSTPAYGRYWMTNWWIVQQIVHLHVFIPLFIEFFASYWQRVREREREQNRQRIVTWYCHV